MNRELLTAAFDLDDDASDSQIRTAVLEQLGGYRTIENVELLAVGMDWPTQPEPSTITLQNLVDAMVACNEDRLIRRPRVKLGHERWQLTPEGVEELGDFDPFWSGQPAFGSVTNLRLNDQGTRLIGDLVEVPDWLADIAPSGYPNRSCEWVWAVTTEGGKTYSLVLTAVALLGTQQQALKNLADLTRALVQPPETASLEVA